MSTPAHQPRPPRTRGAWDRRQAVWIAIASLIVIDLIPFVTGLKKNRLLTIAIYEGIEGEPLKPLAKRFSSGTGADVQIFEYPYDDLYEQEKNSVAARHGSPDARFDVILLDDPWLEGLLLGEKGASSAPRLSTLSGPQGDDLADFFPSCLRVCQHPYCENQENECSKAYYALPFVGNTQLLCYREDRSGPPKTWDDVTSRPNAPGSPLAPNLSYAMRLGPGNSIVTDLIPFFWAADRDSLAPLGRADLKPEIKTALSRIEMLSKETPSFGTRSMDDFDLAVYMADGKASRSIIWAAYAMTIKNVGSEPDAVKTQFGPLPGVPVLGAWLLAAPSNRDNQELARQFIAFATGKEELVRAAAAGNPPPRKSVLDEDFRKLYSEPFANALEQSLDHARPRPRWRDWKQVELQIGACLSDLSASLIQPEDALIRINSRIKPADQPISGAVASCHEDRSDSGESHTRQTPH